MTRARRELLSLEDTPYYHCICRCVRRAFLCGEDSFTGKSFEHRKGWVLERLRELEAVFAVELCAYAVMSNHYHLVVRVNREQAQAWTDVEVMERWKRLFSLPLLVANYERSGCATEAEREAAREIVSEWRRRLSDLSWYMRSLNEHLARRANEEDGCKGRFWEGRFKSQALLDEAAVLTCMSYVDLNPVRAGVAETPETSDFTSIQQRIRELQFCGNASDPGEIRAAPHLMPLDAQRADAHPNRFSFSTRDYLELVDWAGRAVRSDKRGSIPSDLPPILGRLHLEPSHFLRHIERGGRAHHAAAFGHVNVSGARLSSSDGSSSRGWARARACFSIRLEVRRGRTSGRRVGKMMGVPIFPPSSHPSSPLSRNSRLAIFPAASGCVGAQGS